jgi:hypothetical protein
MSRTCGANLLPFDESEVCNVALQVYPPWRWFEKQDVVKKLTRKGVLRYRRTVLYDVLEWPPLTAMSPTQAGYSLYGNVLIY